MRKVLSFFDSTTKVLVAIGGLIAAVAAIIAGWHAVFGSPPSTDTVAQRVTQCESTHGMTQQHAMKTLSDSHFAFESCAWPPPSHADADGHLTITVFTDSGPDSDEAGYDYADRLTGPCDAFLVTYDFGSQGAFDHLAPFAVDAGTVATVSQGGARWTGNLSDLPFYPERAEGTVLHNGRYILRDATCKS